jgi:hypothetical protein
MYSCITPRGVRSKSYGRKASLNGFYQCSSLIDIMNTHIEATPSSPMRDVVQQEEALPDEFLMYVS